MDDPSPGHFLRFFLFLQSANRITTLSLVSEQVRTPVTYFSFFLSFCVRFQHVGECFLALLVSGTGNNVRILGEVLKEYHKTYFDILCGYFCSRYCNICKNDNGSERILIDP